MKFLQKKSEDAISPVVGVMLMIVVTVIIVAVVSAFGTGIIGDDTTQTPITKLEFDAADADMISGYPDGKGTLVSVDFSHRGGDPLLFENIEFSLKGSSQLITNYFPGSYGNIVFSSITRDEDDDGKIDSAKTGDVASVGDIISIEITGASNWNGRYASGETVEWVLYDTRTDGILASGEFVVPEP